MHCTHSFLTYLDDVSWDEIRRNFFFRIPLFFFTWPFSLFPYIRICPYLSLWCRAATRIQKLSASVKPCHGTSKTCWPKTSTSHVYVDPKACRLYYSCSPITLDHDDQVPFGAHSRHAFLFVSATHLPNESHTHSCPRLLVSRFAGRNGGSFQNFLSLFMGWEPTRWRLQQLAHFTSFTNDLRIYAHEIEKL